MSFQWKEISLNSHHMAPTQKDREGHSLKNTSGNADNNQNPTPGIHSHERLTWDSYTIGNPRSGGRWWPQGKWCFSWLSDLGFRAWEYCFSVRWNSFQNFSFTKRDFRKAPGSPLVGWHHLASSLSRPSPVNSVIFKQDSLFLGFLSPLHPWGSWVTGIVKNSCR